MQSTMKLVYSLLVITYVLDLSAAVPIRWTVETSRVQPAQFEAYHGETLRFEATINGYENPFAITNDYISIYWQTNGMESTYWSAPAMISNNVMIAIWTPEMDAGAATYQCFIGAPGDIYRASFQLRLRPSPGVVPNELPLPVKMLDFAAIEVHNAPYYTRAETDAEIKSVANTTLEAANAYTDEHSGGVDTNTVIALANEAILTNETLIARENDIRDKAWEGYTIDDVYTPGIKRNTMDLKVQAVQINGIYPRLQTLENNFNICVIFSDDDPLGFQTASGIYEAAKDYVDTHRYVPSKDDTTFSNAVVSVTLPIGEDEIAVLREIGDLPIGEGATGIGALLAALATAVVWLKRKTKDVESAASAADTKAQYAGQLASQTNYDLLQHSGNDVAHLQNDERERWDAATIKISDIDGRVSTLEEAVIGANAMIDAALGKEAE